MKKITFKLLMLMLAIMLILSGCTSMNEDIVAKVNGVKITKENFEKTSLKVGKEYEMIFGENIWNSEVDGGQIFKDVFKEEILNVMISQELVSQQADKEGIKVTEQEISNELKSFKEYIGKMPTYLDFLKESQIDDEFLKSHIKQNLIFEKYRNKIMSESNIDESELRAYYEAHLDEYKKEEIKASHIFISTLNSMKEPLSEEETAKKESEAKELLKRLKSGEDFAKLAKEYSEDDASAVNGGDLGYFTKGVMLPEFEEAAFKLNKGEMSDIVKSPSGYHIIKVFDKKVEISNFEDEKENILGVIRYDIYDKKMKELQSKANIERYDDIINE
ncbi:MAG: foldase protein PrsA [Proteocatella sp.]